MTDLTALVAAGTTTQSQQLVIGEGADADAMQASGRWLASDTVWEVQR